MKFKNPFITFSYIFSLGLLLIVPILLIKQKTPSWFIIITCVGIGILHFIGFIFVAYFIEERINRSFRIEYDLIYKNYKDTLQAEIFYDKLHHMKHKAKTTTNKNAYYLSLSTAAYKTKRFEEALLLLTKINTENDENMKKAIIGQKEIINKIYLNSD